MSALPLFYYPATVVWVDDDELLLSAATEFLGDAVRIKTFNSPKVCLNYFENYSSHLSKMTFLSGCSDYEEYDTINHLPVDINTTALRELPDHSERQDEVCVLIVDYLMPGMNGVELCRQLKNKNFKKILLTGEADSELAVRAFNEGVIDCYIRKSSPDLIAEIMEYLNVLSNEFFYERSKNLLTHLEIDKKNPLSDPIFVTFFKSWCKKNRITEHYIFDKQGNMQLVDDAGNKTLFIVHTDRTLDDFVELYLNEKDMQAYVNAVSLRQKIPFFGIGLESWQYDFNEWSQYFYAPEIINGRENYYWFIKKQ